MRDLYLYQVIKIANSCTVPLFVIIHLFFVATFVWKNETKTTKAIPILFMVVMSVDNFVFYLKATGGGTNYSDLINHNKIVVSPEVENPESDTTIKDEDVDENADENVDSVSTIDPETRDWLDAPALDKNRFVAKPTYVDWDFNVTMQLVDGSKLTFCNY